MKYVYQLEIRGADGLTAGFKKSRSSTVFSSMKSAESRVSQAKEAAFSRNKCGVPMFSEDYPLDIEIIKLEVIGEDGE